MVVAEAGFCLKYCCKVIKMVMSACTAVPCGEIKETNCKKDIGKGESVVQKICHRITSVSCKPGDRDHKQYR